MWDTAWRALLAILFIKVAVALRFPGNGSQWSDPLLARQDDDGFDGEDLSYIRNLAAIGDSYSAGIGAGKRLGSLFDALDPKGSMYLTLTVTKSERMAKKQNKKRLVVQPLRPCIPIPRL